MKSLAKYLLMLFLTLMVIVVAAYTLLRTGWGISTACSWISDKTAYHLSIAQFRHHWSDPLNLILRDVTFGEDSQPALVVAKQINLRLNLQQIFHPVHYAAIEVYQGAVNLDNLSKSVALPFYADALSLYQVKVARSQQQMPLLADNVNATIRPWHPSADSLFGQDVAFNVNATDLWWGGHTFKHVKAAGQSQSQQLYIRQLAGHTERGTFDGSLTRQANGQWIVEHLELDKIRFQTDKTLAQLLHPLFSHPITIKALSVRQATLQGPDWAVTDLNSELADFQNLNSSSSDIRSGQLALHAESFVAGAQQLDNPQLNLTADQAGITLRYFSTRWAQGEIQFSGRWERRDKQLNLDRLSIKDIRFTLPAQWRQALKQNTPSWLSSVNIDQFNLNNAPLIDIDAHFPFQLTSLYVTGQQLRLANHFQWGFRAGESEWQAVAATFNRQDIRALWFKLTATQQAIMLNNLKMLVADRPVIGEGWIRQESPHHFSATLQGQKIPLNFLHAWGWPAIQTWTGNLQLSLQGHLTPLSVNGTLHRLSPNGKPQKQQIINNRLIPASIQ